MWSTLFLSELLCFLPRTLCFYLGFCICILEAVVQTWNVQHVDSEIIRLFQRTAVKELWISVSIRANTLQHRLHNLNI